jgi:hypothetical protein
MSYIQNMNCPYCRIPIPKHLTQVKIAGCPKCGMVSTMGTDGYLRTQKAYSILGKNYQEPFFLGEEIRHNNVFYTVFAVYGYAVTYQEWDSEDSRWVSGSGLVTEWYARSSHNLQLVVTKDVDNQFYAVQDSHNNQISDKHIQEKAIEIGTFDLYAFAGTDDEPLETSGFYRCYPNNILLESQKEDFSKKNFKTFFLKELTPSQLKRMEVIPETIQTEAEDDFKNITFYRNVFGYALLVILGLMFLGSLRTDGTSRTNQEGVSESRRIAFENFTKSDGKTDTLALRPQSAGVFNLKKGKNYLFLAQCSVSGKNADADFSVSVIRKEDEALVSEVDIAFYAETGRDSEGDWTENYLSDEFKFQVDKTGSYEVFVAPDYDDLVNYPNCSLMISVHPTGYHYYYLMAAGALLLGFVVFQWQREHIVAYANLPHGTYLHDITRQ